MKSHEKCSMGRQYSCCSALFVSFTTNGWDIPQHVEKRCSVSLLYLWFGVFLLTETLWVHSEMLCVQVETDRNIYKLNPHRKRICDRGYFKCDLICLKKKKKKYPSHCLTSLFFVFIDEYLIHSYHAAK